ncbi:MAG TPA: helix-hairpin-helix domain-containing protein [Dehalococcoidia bacterium]|nr:helix-hairpin-helix domain-containing protein [Dehalococcoidia bacterium]
MSRTDRFYLFITVFLAIAVVVGSVMLVGKHTKSQPIEIVLSQTAPPEQSGEVYIGGAVANPGLYSLKEDDTIQALLLDAGIKPDADLNYIKIYIPQKGENQSPQKIDINRAENWLLEALPGVGEVTAQAIVDYRNGNGPFKRIEGLLQVKGIGQGTFNKIKDYITVLD